MIWSKTFLFFIAFSFLGWIWECFYMTIKNRQWSNRGFFFGPICPIYGGGAVGCIYVFQTFSIFKGSETPWWQIFLVCAVGSIVLEYGTSVILEKRFHAIWWDYSDMPLNINGRVCLPATIAFGCVGLLIMKKLLPWLLTLNGFFSAHPLWLEFTSLVIMGFLGMDFAMSIESMTSLTEKMMQIQQEFDDKMQAGYEGLSAQMSTRVGDLSKSLTSYEKRALGAIVKFKVPGVSKLEGALKERLHPIYKKVMAKTPETQGARKPQPRVQTTRPDAQE